MSRLTDEAFIAETCTYRAGLNQSKFYIMSQIEKMKKRAAILLLNIIVFAPNKRERNELKRRYDVLKNQIRIAELITERNNQPVIHQHNQYATNTQC